MAASEAVAIVGLGRLGLPMAAATAAAGYCVLGVDVDRKRVQAVDNGRSPFYEPDLQDYLDRARGRGRLYAWTDTLAAVRQSGMTFVFVPTPNGADGGFSSDAVVAACRTIGDALAGVDDYHIVVIRSTIMPGAMEKDVIPALEAASGKRCGVDFGACYSPEFLALGTAIHDYLHPDFVLIGESDTRAGDALETFYRNVCHGDFPAIRTNFINAELGKLLANNFLMLKATYANLMARICENLPGANVDRMTQILGSWRHISPNFLKGATAYGGTCWPRDEKAILALLADLALPQDLPEAMIAMNEDEPWRLVWEVVDAMPDASAVVGVLGLSFKPGTPETTCGPAVRLVPVVRHGAPLCRLVGYDPLAFPVDGIERLETAQAVADVADVVIVPIPDRRYQDVRWKAGQTVIDVWRILDGEEVTASGAVHVPMGVGR